MKRRNLRILYFKKEEKIMELNKLNICFSGAARGETVDLDYKKAFEVGELIAKKGHTLLTGATIGLPDWAAQGCRNEDGLSIGLSPAASKLEHVKKYRLPIESYDFILYTGLNYIGRDTLLIQSADCVVFVGGRMGTVHEFATAIETHKPIGILTDSGGTSEEFDDLLKAAGRCNHNSCEKHDIFFESDPNILLDKLILATKMKFAS
jgi:uncharacterized protein (TIGR00725 family)